MILDLGYDAYAWTRVLHVVSVTAWIAGLVGLSEVFAVHAAEPENPAWSGRARALLTRLVIPASGLALASGVVLVLNYGELREGWLHAKFLGIGLLLVHQTVLSRFARGFVMGTQHRAPAFFRSLKLFPIVLFIVIVALVIVRPF